MRDTLTYHPGTEMFFLQHGDSMRPYTMIQVWNLGVTEQAIRVALLNPHKRIDTRVPHNFNPNKSPINFEECAS